MYWLAQVTRNGLCQPLLKSMDAFYTVFLSTCHVLDVFLDSGYSAVNRSQGFSWTLFESLCWERKKVLKRDQQDDKEVKPIRKPVSLDMDQFFEVSREMEKPFAAQPSKTCPEVSLHWGVKVGRQQWAQQSTTSLGGEGCGQARSGQPVWLCVSSGRGESNVAWPAGRVGKQSSTLCKEKIVSCHGKAWVLAHCL
jgi:hypothetical protein